MITATDIKKINTDTLKKILEACERAFPKELGLEDYFGEAQNTSGNQDLLNYVETLTDTKNIRLAYAKIFEEVESRTQEAPRPKEQEKTTLNKDESEELIQEAEKRESQKRETVSKSNKEVEDFLIRKQEIIDKQKIDNIKKIVVVPTEEIHTVTLSEKEKEELFNLKQAVNNDPATVQKIIEEKITQSVNTSQNTEIINSVTPEVVSKTAYSITQNITGFPDYNSISEIPTVIPVLNPSSPLITLSDINNDRLKKIIPDDKIRQKIVERAQTIAIALEAERSVNVAGSNAALGSENITSIFYGDNNITQFQVSEQQEEERDEGIEIDPQEVYKQGEKINEIWGKLINKTATVKEVGIPASTFIVPYAPAVDTALVVKSSSLALKALPVVGAAFGFKQGALISHWARSGPSFQVALSAGSQRFFKMLTSGPMDSAIFLSQNIISNPSFFALTTKSGNFSIALGKGISETGSKIYAGKLAINLGGKVSTIAAATGSKVATTGIFAKALTFLGGLSSWATLGLSLIAGWILGKIIEKINWKKVKEYFLPVVAIGGGLLIGGPVGLTMMVGGGLFAAGALGSVAKTGLFFSRLGTALGGIAITIATPVIVALLIIPPTVAFFMFVINSGAYIVPPSYYSSTIGADNPYVLVTKTAEPSKIGNPTSKTTVTYTVTIRALKSSLINIKIVTTECNVITKDKRSINCPTEDIPEIDEALSISPASNHSFTFTSDYDSNYHDSLVYDTITISADTTEQNGITTTGSANVCIGDCPLDCVEVSDLKQKWPTNLKSNTETALGKLSSEYPKFMAKVCARNEELKMCYAPSLISPNYFAWHIHNANGDGCDVYFNEKGLGGNYTNALFLLTHELTHHIQDINGSETRKYEESGSWEEVRGRGFCSYSATSQYSTEAMAEAAGLYASIPSWATCVSSYQNMYPKNYIFAKGFMK